MDKRWRDVALDLALGLYWFLSGYFLLSVFGVPEWSLRAGLINLILGMVLVALGTWTDRGARQLYQGVKDEETPPNLPLILVIILPFLCFIFGVVGWAIYWLNRWFGN